MKKIAALIIIVFLGTNILLQGQKSLNLFNFNTENYPLIKAELFMLDNSGKAVYNYSQSDYRIFDNGILVAPDNLFIPQQEPVNEMSFVITYDLANMNFNLSKQFTQIFIQQLNSNIAEAALISFDKNNYLEYPFTKDFENLTTALNNLERSPGSFYDAALTRKPISSLFYSDYANYAPAIVIVTDNAAKFDYEQALNLASNNNVKIFVVSIGRNLPQEIKNLCLATNGFYVENVPPTQFTKTAGTIINYAYGFKPVTLSWHTGISCNDTTNVEIYIPKDDIGVQFEFIRKTENKPFIQAVPPYLGFSSVLPTTYMEQDITIIARNSDIFVKSLSIPDARFQIVAGDFTNELIEKDTDRALKIRYTPTDSAIVFTRLLIESDACSGEEIYITGGYPNTPPKTKTIDLIRPVCPGTLIVGQETIVEWIGLLPRDIVQLEVSYNNGERWDTLKNNTQGLTFPWIVPDSLTDEGLIRIIQMWPNNVGRTIDLPHSKPVNTAFFNKDGSLAITSSNDSTAVVWNANTGNKILTLRGHKNTVVHAKFDPTEKYAVTASRDSTAIIWDLQTGEKVHILTGHKGPLRSACFNHQGNFVATSSIDGTVRLWDIVTGNQVMIINVTNTYTVEFSSFHPSNGYILVTSSDGWVREYETSNGELVRRFYTGVVSATHCIYNHDGTKFAVTSEGYKTVQVWDIQDEEILFSVSHNDDETTNYVIKSSSFLKTSNNEFLLTASDDNTARLWSAENGAPLPPHIFSEHTNTVNTAVFDFDASRVLTASADNYAKIWKLDDVSRSLQIDTTCFSIAFAEADAIDIDMGAVVVGSALDSLIIPFIINTSKFDFDVKSVRLSGGNSEDFQILNNPYTPFILDSLGFKSIQIRFAPTLLGTRQTELLVEIPGKTLRAKLTGIGIDNELNVQNNFIDFSEVFIGDFKDTSFTVFISNNSTGNIIIDSLVLNGVNQDNFNILDGEAHNTNLVPGASLPLSLRFRPNETGYRYSKLIYYHSGIENPKIISLFGVGIIAEWDSITISIPDLYAETGEIIDIPIYATEIGSKGLSENVSGIKTNFRFNATILEPLFNYEQSEITGSERKVIYNIVFPEEVTDSSVLALLPFRVGLGNDTLTPIIIEYSEPNGKSKLLIKEISGSLKVTNVCEEGGLRLIDSDGRLTLSQNKPNPANNTTTIEFEVIEPGLTKLQVFAINGNLIANLHDGKLTPGAYAIDLDLSQYNVGTYYYILTTPTHRLIRSMNVIK